MLRGAGTFFFWGAKECGTLWPMAKEKTPIVY